MWNSIALIALLIYKWFIWFFSFGFVHFNSQKNKTIFNYTQRATVAKLSYFVQFLFFCLIRSNTHANLLFSLCLYIIRIYIRIILLYIYKYLHLVRYFSNSSRISLLYRFIFFFFYQYAHIELFWADAHNKCVMCAVRMLNL